MAVAFVLLGLIFNPMFWHSCVICLRDFLRLGNLCVPLETRQMSSAKMNMSTRAGNGSRANLSISMLKRYGLSMPPCGVPF